MADRQEPPKTPEQDAEDARRLDRGVKLFYIATTLLVAYGAIAALFRV